MKLPSFSSIAKLERWKVIIVALVLVLGFGRCAWNRSVAHGIADQQLAAQLKEARQREAIASAYANTVKASVYRDTLRITRTIRSVDTLYATLPETVVTQADTVRVVQAFPILRAGYDSLKASCSDLQRNALRYVSACDSIQGALRAQRDILTKQLHAERPKWYATPLKFIEIGGAAYLGYRVGRGR